MSKRTMKAITIKQPWASLIATGLKDIENRSWKTNYRGRVLIHAAAAPVKEGLAALNNKQLFDLMKRENWEAEFENLPNGAIIGSVEIVDCVQNHPSKWAQEGVWNWVLANPELYAEPIIGVKGKLSFWEYDGELPQKPNAVEVAPQPSPAVPAPPMPPMQMPSLEEIKERLFRKDVKSGTQKMMERLTLQEQMQVSFTPLVITQCAWVYAFKAMELAARDKISILKKLTRTLKMVREKYEDELRRELTYTAVKNIEQQAERFLQFAAHDLTILYFTVNQEILRCAPEYPCVEQRSYSIISTLFVALLEEHNKRMDKLLAEKLDDSNLSPNIMNPLTKHLNTGMVAFAGVEGRFNEENPNIKLSMKIIARKLNEIEFTITHD